MGEPRQPVRQQVSLDARKRRDALGIGDEAAFALRNWLALGEQALHRYVDVTEFARHPYSSPDDSSRLDHSTPEACADDRRNRRS